MQTAKLQGLAGDPNAGVSDEERAAKAGLGASVDADYAAAHPNDVNANSKRLGGFMPIGLDLDGDGTVSTVSMANSHVSFDWDGTGYKKNVGWVAGNDGFLVLDSNFNASVDNGSELVSNPLVSDQVKGLRNLAAFDANADGRIDASDPVYQQLQVWQDFNQDGRNVHGLLVGDKITAVQDETGGVMELRSLAQAGIVAIDYGNARVERDAAHGGGYSAATTLTLEAAPEGQTYQAAGAGILIKSTNGRPEVVVTKVLSEAAVFSTLGLQVGNESIGTTPDDRLYEDGSKEAWNPNTQGYLPITVNAQQLLANDTWHGGVGVAANGERWAMAA